MSPNELVELFRNLSLAIAGPVGVWVAWKGVKAWKDEQHWKVDYDLALQIYKKFRLRRDIYHFIRSPLADPPVLEDQDAETEIRKERLNGDQANVLNHYWDALKNVEVNQSALFDEARLRWDEDLREMSDDMRDLENELAYSLSDFQAAQNGEFVPDAHAAKAVDEVLRSQQDTEQRKDKYNDCFNKIEAKLKPRIVGSRGWRKTK
ncbi:hypothetical protein [Tateyamaria sp. Alg231-49]|uniref:hypothetical protein n=1 Tax=Tateyamaria sp. Alg231-49 TaxID=1922219 RepID=UPI000D5505A7|nr:hypothetical protein [Tateyamaria sp. Alg231-49]